MNPFPIVRTLKTIWQIITLSQNFGSTPQMFFITFLKTTLVLLSKQKGNELDKMNVIKNSFLQAPFVKSEFYLCLFCSKTDVKRFITPGRNNSYLSYFVCLFHLAHQEKCSKESKPVFKRTPAFRRKVTYQCQKLTHTSPLVHF